MPSLLELGYRIYLSSHKKTAHDACAVYHSWEHGPHCYDEVTAPFLEDYPAAHVGVNPWSSSQGSSTVFYQGSNVAFFRNHLILASAFSRLRLVVGFS